MEALLLDFVVVAAVVVDVDRTTLRRCLASDSRATTPHFDLPRGARVEEDNKDIVGRRAGDHWGRESPKRHEFLFLFFSLQSFLKSKKKKERERESGPK